MIPVAMALLPGLLLAQHNVLTAEEQQAGWTLLFDGKTMKNWVDPRLKNPAGDAWEVTEDGCLHTLAHPKITEDLFTAESYRDFELSFDWRISPAGNSGVKYRIQDHRFMLAALKGETFEASMERTLIEASVPRRAEGQDYVIGFEYQLTDNMANKDALNAGPTHSTGALYGMAAPANAKPRALPEFNTSRIVLKGNHVQHWLNGVKVVDTTLDSAEVVAAIHRRWRSAPPVEQMLSTQPKKDCPISLQNHGDEAWFRDIKIKKL